MAGVVALGVVVWLWERGPNLAPDTRDGLSPAQQIQAVGQYRTTLIQASAAVGGVIALGYTARNYWLSRRGQTTDRFTKALERLGSADLYVRAGAVYALEQVFRDSPEHHADIVSVLLGFVHAKTRLTAPPRVRRDTTTHHGVHAVGLTMLPDPLDHPIRPHADIQAALTVLGRLPNNPQILPHDLTDLHLTGAWLYDANLTRALLYRTNLTNATLDCANLTDTHFDWANLTEASLDGANLTKASLDQANLTKASLDRTNLTKASLNQADLIDASLDRANLTAARLDRADLTDARLRRANLTRAQLVWADVTRNQVNEALHADRAKALPAHLMWDQQLGRVRDATAEETAATKARHRRKYPQS